MRRLPGLKAAGSSATQRWGAGSSPASGPRHRGEGHSYDIQDRAAIRDDTIPYSVKKRGEREVVLLNRKRSGETVSICDTIAFDLSPRSAATTHAVRPTSASPTLARDIKEDVSTRTAGLGHLHPARHMRVRSERPSREQSQSSHHGPFFGNAPISASG